MRKFGKKITERRKFLRVEAPLTIRAITSNNLVIDAETKNISPMGIRFENEACLEKGEVLDISVYLPEVSNPVHLTAKVVWCRRISLEDNAPYDVGVEFDKIEEDNKNTFLRFFCKLLYNAARLIEE